MSVALWCQDLRALPASRVRTLDQRIAAEGLGGIEAVYALVWPEYAPPLDPIPRLNREAFADWRSAAAGVPLWGWFNCGADQVGDGEKLNELTPELAPAGWKLDIEGEWMKQASLEPLLSAAAATGLPLGASLAGASSSHTSYDFRSLERHGLTVDWQAYFDSGEGPTPTAAVRELYSASFVIPGWEYRHRLGSSYGWGKVTRVEAQQRATFDSYKRPGVEDATFAVGPREWGHVVVSRMLQRNGRNVGLLMGRAAYPNIRVTLDVTRTASSRPPGEWEPIAASARIPGARKRPVSVYLAERTSDDVIVAIARGAA